MTNVLDIRLRLSDETFREYGLCTVRCKHHLIVHFNDNVIPIVRLDVSVHDAINSLEEPYSVSGKYNKTQMHVKCF